MLAFVFPGQGSQRRGMGEGLFDEVPAFIEAEREIDRLLGYSIRDLCIRDPENRLGQTQYTQPALYVANALHYYRALSQEGPPALLAGHSLGEYNALLAAGAFDFLTGLRIVQKRGELMSRAKNGGMAAVIGLASRRIGEVLRDPSLLLLDVSGFNTPTQAVISGPRDALERAEAIFTKAGANLYVPLDVSAAFHSRYMADAGAAFSSYLGSIRFSPLKARIFSNVTGQEYPPGDPSEVIRSLLTKQLTQPVRWTQNVRAMIAAGATSFKEIGPGTVLTRLISQIQREHDL